MRALRLERPLAMSDPNSPVIPILREGVGRHRLGTATEQSALVFKGSSFSLMVAHLATPDLERVERELVAKTAQAPTFFQDTAIVLDLQAIDGQPLELKALLDLLRAHGTHPLGVRHGDVFQQTEARALGLVLFPALRKDESRPPPQEPRAKPRIWSQPVRSGQQVYAAGGDLILLGMVNSGAEVLADGNIHCYAPLRGRALAGVKGDVEARIFTYCLEAELLTIAGFYRVVEDVKDLPREVRGKPAQIYLSGERVMIESI
ncbi:putative septum site-determining protein MinC [Gammaproteobacteria bacterium]